MPRYSYGITIRVKLRRLRKTQQQLARAVGYSPSYISMFLSGKIHNPELKLRVAEVLTGWEQAL